MATAYITRHTVDAGEWPRLSSGQAIAALSGHEGDCIELGVGGAAEHMSAPASSAGLYRILIVGGDARVAVGAGAVATAKGEFWPDGTTELRFLRTGERISVLAA